MKIISINKMSIKRDAYINISADIIQNASTLFNMFETYEDIARDTFYGSFFKNLVNVYPISVTSNDVQYSPQQQFE